MSNTNETIAAAGPGNAGDPLAAILAEMRDERIIRLDGADVTRCLLRNLADRIEAAVKSGEVVLRLSKEAYKGMQDALSEHDRLCEMLSVSRESIGNAAAMREALERCNELFRCDDGNKPRLCSLARKADEATQAALAVPARNCDVLSEKEANEAWKEYMRSHAIPRGGWDFRHVVAWLYAEVKGKEESNG